MQQTEPVSMQALRSRLYLAQSSPSSITPAPLPHPVPAPIITRNLAHAQDGQQGQAANNGVSGQQANTVPPARSHFPGQLDTVSPLTRTGIYQLQTHLGLLIGFAENVQAAHTRMSPEELERQLALIAKNGHRLSEMLDELLAVAATDETG